MRGDINGISLISPQNWERHQNYSKLLIEAAKMEDFIIFNHILSMKHRDLPSKGPGDKNQ